MPYPFSVGEVLTATNLNAAIGAVPIATVTNPGGVSFTLANSISSSYRHLLIVGSAKHDNGSGAGAVRDLGFTVNNDTSAGYDSLLTWSGSGATSATTENGTNGRLAQVFSTTSPFQAFLPNYTSTAINKSTVGDFTVLSATASSIRRGQSASRSPITAALTRIDITLIAGGGDVFDTGTIVTLYGLT